MTNTEKNIVLAAFLLNFWLIHRIDLLVGVNATRAIIGIGAPMATIWIFWTQRYKMMTLAEAMQARNIRLCDLSRQSGVSRPTLDGILGKKKVFNQTGVRTETLLRLAKALDADIAIDGTKPYYFELTLRG